MVHHNDVAWHASRANGDSIGIEHVANTRGLLPTETQYCNSAALVRWLCEQYGIPMDRQHILGHAEADTRTTHSACPNAVWNWDYFMGMVTSGSCYPMPTAAAQGLSGRSSAPRSAQSYGAAVHPFSDTSFDVHWSDVQLVPQPTTMSCWAAAAAMIVGWRDRVSIDPAEIAARTGHWAEYDLANGLYPSDHRNLGLAWRLHLEPPQDYTIDGLRQLLQNNGPLWVGVAVPSGHAVALTGIFGDGTVDGTFVRVNDPWPPGRGSQYEQGLRQFMQEYDNRVTVDATGTVNIQILHAGGRNGASTVQSYAMTHRRGESATRPESAGDLWARPYAMRHMAGRNNVAHNGHANSNNGAVRQPTYAAALALAPVAGEAVAAMRAEFVANASSGSPRNCITITNAGLRQFYGASLKNADGSAKALGSTIQDSMAQLQSYGLAQTPAIFEFNDAAGNLTRGVNRPQSLRSSLEQWLLAEGDANAQSAWYVFGLSIMDGYHSVVLALAFSGPNHPDTKIYWADQIYNGWDDVTGALDQRITSLTQRWWDPLPANRKARTRVTLWPLNPGAPAASQGFARGRALTGEETDGVDAYEDDMPVYGQALTAGECTDGFCPTNQAATAGTTNFALSEFHCKDGTQVPERFRGSVQTVMENLEVLRAELGGAPVTVNSGYRTCGYNASVGGENRSRHLCGQAADITVSGYTPEEVHTTIERLIQGGQMRQGGLGLYPGRFVHYDIRGARARWTGRGRSGNGARSQQLSDPGAIVPDYSHVSSFGEAASLFFDWLARGLRFTIGVPNTHFFPHSAICKIYTSDSSGSILGQGSGFYVGYNKVVTAAHVLNDTSYHPAGIQVVPGLNGTEEPFGGMSLPISVATIHPRYVPGGDRSFDIAVINNAPDAPNGEFFSMEELNMSPSTGIITCGYAAVGVDPTRQHLDIDTIRELHNGTFIYAAQVRQGSSGGPVFYALDPLTVRVVGLNVTTYNAHENQGLRLTNAMIGWVNGV
jgi:V8-like Glu-specific endopeptidase